jgi:GTPase
MMKFIDEAKIYIRSGKGGDGMVSFARGFRTPKGGPDGGDGGPGGSVIFVGDGQMETLLDYQYQQHFRAQPGGNGGKNNCTGAEGEDCRIKVPPGTRIRVETGRGASEGEILGSGEEFAALLGGRGGRGNTRFKSSVRRAPQVATEGGPAEEGTAYLTLQLIADVGILGLPNVGKSTLLNALTRAHSPSADYPFTTLRPYLGILERGEERLTLADLPGLIEGAAAGVGLGIRFLKHAERTRLFLHLLDLALPAEEVIASYEVVRRELANYSPALLRRPQLAAGNKLDLCPERAKLKKVRQYFQKEKVPFTLLSAKEGEGIARLAALLFRHCPARPQAPRR